MADNLRRSLWISGGVIVGSFLLFGAAFWWLGEDVETQAASAFADRSIITNRARAVETLARLKQNSLLVKGYEDQVNALLPTQDGLLDLSKWINTFSRVHDVAAQFSFLGSVTPSTAGAAGSTGFTLDTNGPLDGILKFLRALEVQSPRFLVSLSGFDVTRLSGGGARVQVKGQAYFR